MTITLDRPVHTSTATAISYRDLTPQQQNGWHSLETLSTDLEAAAEQGANVVAELLLAHATAALFLGIQLPAGDTLVACTCENCPEDCDRITAATLCSEDHSGYGPVIQCGTCTDEHRSLGD
ncbi:MULTISPECIES: hypothetical protein [unclassified Streptomyces]|uniref:hypothetical protein n=1 Tax=unclassified Streptomyces TaxID=2593676 RepID=UPI0008944B2F|nr:MULTISPECIES: hypothetical protein [unclassified Streptomyces]PBC72332.1 hypothetical protein BX261_7416 [Streptomyces sp. 2321.6]SEE50557.1 hypothetical protein SAMN05428940_7336 [Streptomyces sp. 2133.1]SNC77836.1 hypothetical protein SAMN06272741_7252 [Streptomyces sp. 2114.4]